MKVKSKILSLFYRIKRKSKWNVSKFNLQYGITILHIKNMLEAIMKLILLITAVVIFYISIGAVELSLNGMFIHSIDFPTNSFEAKDVVLTQINVTLIVTSIIALVSNVENKYILGVHAVEYFFPNKGVSSFAVVFIILFASMFLNVALLFQGYADIYILSIFIISVFCIAYVTYRFASIYISPGRIKSKFLIKYYKGNLQHIQKAKPLETNINKDIEVLKNVTLMHMRKDELQYLENIEIYFNLLKITLYNNSKLIQEYYTESINHSDLIAHIRAFSNELYRVGKHQDSIRLYSRLLKQLNYHKLILVNMSSSIYGDLSIFVQHTKNIETESVACDWHKVLWQIFIDSYLQIYNYSIADLSYCRLAHLGMIHYFPINSNLADYYTAIFENQHLIDIEKARLCHMFYDSIRMSEHNYKYPARTVDNYNIYNQLPNSLNVPVWILAEPVALLFLRIVENNDVENLIQFNHMNLSSKMMFSIRTLCLLSIISMLSRNNKRTYLLDIKINPSIVKKLVYEARLIPNNFIYEEFIEVFTYISDHYTFALRESEHVKGSYYQFSPMFRFEKFVVDTYFYQLLDATDKQKEFSDIANNLEIDSRVQSIIQSFYLESNTNSYSH